MVHVAHHKVGTVWFHRALRAVASEHGLNYAVQSHVAKVSVLWGRNVDLALLRAPFTGSHLVRDPRDVIVSGYHYHLWTTEAWAHQPLPELGGQSYQEHLKSLLKHDGLLAEISFASLRWLRDMAEWQPRPEFLELRYEDLLGNERATFERLFLHHGFTSEAAMRAAEMCDRFSFERITGRQVGQIADRSHHRSGRPQQWQEELGPEHLARLDELLPDLLIRTGYR